MDYIKIIITIAIAVGGWVTGHHFTSAQNLETDKRELTTKYLIEAYRTFEKHSEATCAGKHWSSTEEAVADIQLFGSKEQIRLSKESHNRHG